MRSDPKLEIVHRFFSGTGPTYDRIVHLGTIGCDAWWKKRILREIPAEPTRIVDQACGTGILTFAIARKFPACHVIGVELRAEYLDIARVRAAEQGYRNVDFILGRAEDVFLNDRVDCITSSYLATYAEVNTWVRNAGGMLKPGGTLVAHDFTYPRSRAFARVWELYFSLLRSVGSWKYPEWEEAFLGLPKLLRETDWVRELNRCLEENGFSNTRIDPLFFGTSTLVTSRKL